MNIHLYTSQSGVQARRLISTINNARNHHDNILIKSFNQLELNGDTDIEINDLVIMLISTNDELDSLIIRKDKFINNRIIVILGENIRENINKAYLLHPRFIEFTDSDYAHLVEIINKISLQYGTRPHRSFHNSCPQQGGSTMNTTIRQIHYGLIRGLTFLFIMAQLLLSTACSYHQTDVDMYVSITHDGRAAGTEISAHELHKILTGYFGNVFIKLSDAKYTLPDNAKVAALSQFHARQDWDCDDYAIAAMVPMRNYAFGVMYITTARGERHVANVFVNQNREVMFWEAQKNEYYQGKFHKPELIVF